MKMLKLKITLILIILFASSCAISSPSNNFYNQYFNSLYNNEFILFDDIDDSTKNHQCLSEYDVLSCNIHMSEEMANYVSIIEYPIYYINEYMYYPFDNTSYENEMQNEEYGYYQNICKCQTYEGKAFLESIANRPFTEFPYMYPFNVLKRYQYGGFFSVLPYNIVQMVGVDIYLDWLHSRCMVERKVESIAVSFIRYFNITKHDFMHHANRRLTPSPSDWFTLPFDVFFTGNNERINSLFMWENSMDADDFIWMSNFRRYNPYPHEFYWLETNRRIETHRNQFYHMPPPFILLIGRLEYIEWRNTRSEYERVNENIAVSLIRHFNISREDFEEANNLWVDNWRWFPSHEYRIGTNSAFEAYPIELLFSNNNALINRYFSWDYTPSISEFGRSMEIGNFRWLHYNMPAPFLSLVGRENFIKWRDARDYYEIVNENIAVSFIRYFNISKYDFNNANEIVREHRIWWSEDPKANSLFEIYPVDLIFTFDNEAINEFFRWTNSPAEHERGW